MQVDPLMIVAVLGMASLLIERVFYYRSRYKNKNNNPGNYGVKIGKLETRVKNIEDDIGRIKDKLDLI